MFKKTFICSVSSGLLVLLNTGIVDHANAQKPGHVYVETKVGIDGKLLPATIDCTDQTYDIKGDGLAWMSIYQERKSRESILQEYINLCGANKGSVYRFYIKLMEGDIDNRLDVVWRQSPEGLKWEQELEERIMRSIQRENRKDVEDWQRKGQCLADFQQLIFSSFGILSHAERGTWEFRNALNEVCARCWNHLVESSLAYEAQTRCYKW
ncbi:MAG: hypothetical protein KGR70_16545 [Cyanobacteria bacterium REEB494]|nr:hypothetical protein [Cyanobacteria bacterium REEB494]